jgi:hypothetical protein
MPAKVPTRISNKELRNWPATRMGTRGPTWLDVVAFFTEAAVLRRELRTRARRTPPADGGFF